MRFSFVESLAPPAPVPSLSRKREPPPVRAGLDKSLRLFCLEALAPLKGDLQILREQLLVKWNPRMRSTAGRALWPDYEIQLNPRLCEISQEEVQRTMLHELAHLVAYERSIEVEIQAHGPEWRRACAELGIPGERATHDLALPARRMKRQWRYECPFCKTQIDRVRRLKQAAACYECCRKATGGRFHPALRLKEIKL